MGWKWNARDLPAIFEIGFDVAGTGATSITKTHEYEYFEDNSITKTHEYEYFEDKSEHGLYKSR